jgi:predicted  nucleic acid-binding Zn-ribbon protein
MSEGKYDDEALARLAELVSEQIASQFKTALESIDEIKAQVAKIPAIHDDVAELVSDMRAVKQAIKDTNADLRELDERVSRLETSAYHA